MKLPEVIPGQVARATMMAIESPNQLYRHVPSQTVKGTRLLQEASHRLPRVLVIFGFKLLR